MPARAYRNSMNSGVLDPLLYARADLEQWRTGLKTGTNVLLLPQGGVRRRPGLRYVRTLPAATSRVSRFRFNASAQYLLVWSDSLVEVYSSAEAKLTEIATPYPAADLAGLYLRCQTADTLVAFHEDHAPRRLLRGTLSANPVRTTNTSTTVRVKHPAHALLDGDVVGLSGLTTTGGVPAAELNKSQTIAKFDGALGSGPVATTSGSEVVVVTIANHVLVTGDRVEFEGLEAVGGISATQLNKVHTITNTGGSGGSAWVAVNADADATSTTSGGGSAGTWNAPDYYTFSVTTAASSTTSGGGSSGLGWIFHSLAVDADRDVALRNLPQFDFQDAQSPAPKAEVQRLIFANFGTGDEYSLSVGLHRFADNLDRIASDAKSQLILKTSKLTYNSGNLPDNARQMEEAIADLSADNPGQVSVEYDAASSTGTDKHYVFRFTGSRDYDAIEPRVIKSTSGTITQETDVEGGSTEEDVVSATRGWPATGLFYQRRLWMTGLRSRPSTILASQTEDFFNFEVGDALDAEAIDATGEFDPIRHLIGERGLYGVTYGGEISISGGTQGGGITPTNINIEVAGRYGATAVPPVSVGGRVFYVDRVARNVRQLGPAETGLVETTEASILSQHLIDAPVAMDALRSADGDYLFVVNSDGTVAVLNINADQGVAGWSKLETDGAILDVAEVADSMYAVVERTVGGSPVYFIEVFDVDHYLDASVLATGAAASTWSGLDHLEGETVAVRGDGLTLNDQTVVSGDVTTSLAGTTTTPTTVEAGLAFTVTIEPTPPQQGKFTSISRVTIDLFESRAVKVNGYRVKDYLPGEAVTDAPSPLLTGFREMVVRGWGDRQTVTITQTEPQPLTLRALDIEVA